MNSSMYNLDRATHLKVIVVAVTVAALVVAIGKSAQLNHAAPGLSVSELRHPLELSAPSRPDVGLPARTLSGFGIAMT